MSLTLQERVTLDLAGTVAEIAALALLAEKKARAAGLAGEHVELSAIHTRAAWLCDRLEQRVGIHQNTPDAAREAGAV